MDLSPESFERLLSWLHPNREAAGQEYLRIRAILVKHFQSKGCSVPEKLADATIDRTAEKITSELISHWVGQPERYFFRVAFYILREHRDSDLLETQFPEKLDVPAPDADQEKEVQDLCLTKCLGGLAGSDRELMEEYYHGTKAIKKQNRQKLAKERNLELPILRVRAHRLRSRLKTCLQRCLAEAVR